MKIWIIERNHDPMPGAPCFSDTPEGTEKMKAFLNRIPSTEDRYYDAVLYERIEPKVQNLESE